MIPTKKAIESQMTPAMIWENIDVDHVKTISSFYVSNDEELREALLWNITQTLLKQVH